MSGNKLNYIIIVIGLAVLVVGIYSLMEDQNIKNNPGEIEGPLDDKSLESANEIIKNCSEKLNLNFREIEKCLSEGKKKSLIEKDQELADKYHVRPVPGFVVGCKYRFDGAYPSRFMADAIDLAMSENVLNESDFKEWCLERASNKTCSWYARIVGNETCYDGDKIIIYEFFDFGCGECYRAQSVTLPYLIGNSKVSLEQHHLPHTKKSGYFAEAVECSSESFDSDIKNKFITCVFEENFKTK